MKEQIQAIIEKHCAAALASRPHFAADTAASFILRGSSNSSALDFASSLRETAELLLTIEADVKRLVELVHAPTESPRSLLDLLNLAIESSEREEDVAKQKKEKKAAIKAEVVSKIHAAWREVLPRISEMPLIGDYGRPRAFLEANRLCQPGLQPGEHQNGLVINLGKSISAEKLSMICHEDEDGGFSIIIQHGRCRPYESGHEVIYGINEPIEKPFAHFLNALMKQVHRG